VQLPVQVQLGVGTHVAEERVVVAAHAGVALPGVGGGRQVETAVLSVVRGASVAEIEHVAVGEAEAARPRVNELYISVLVKLDEARHEGDRVVGQEGEDFALA